MVEATALKKEDEQYPLLKVDTGGGDGGGKVTTTVTPGWQVTCVPKKSWLVRWPEYISACWMTFILLGISFLVFYALAMEAYRRQPVLIVRCNDSKPASDVYFHQVVQQGSYISFMIYSGYLAKLATKYPSLHFHVLFLVDDSRLTAIRGPKHNRFINKLIPYTPYITSRLEENNKREIREFQRKFQNFNISIGSLSNYMESTPLKYKWRSLPIDYIPFYARVLSVWQNGGVSMDLNAFNKRFSTRQCEDRRISAILQQHNDGINAEEYKNALDKINQDEDFEFFSMVHAIIDQVLNNTRSFLSTVTAKNTQNETLIRTHRNKREVASTVTNNLIEKPNVTIESLNATNITDFKNYEYLTITPTEALVQASNISVSISPNNVSSFSGLYNKSAIANKPKVSQVIWFYDISLIADSFMPQNLKTDFVRQPNLSPSTNSDSRKSKRNTEQAESVQQLLSIDSEGLFISAALPLHPFLSYLMSADCQRLYPKHAIKDAMLTLCSGMLKDEVSCNNIFIL